MSVPLAVLVATGGTAAGLLLTGTSSAGAAEPAPVGVTVDGSGEVSGTPDVLRVDLGVEQTRPDVGAALAAANSSAAAMTAALARHHVPASDVQTSTVQINQHYTAKGVPDGYTVFEGVTARLHDLGDAGPAIGDAVTAGGNAARLQGVTFALEDNKSLLQQARNAAYADAKAKAEQYARLAGRSLGDVTSVKESVGPAQPRPVPEAFAADAAGSAALPLSPGQQSVTVTVTVVWSLR